MDASILRTVITQVAWYWYIHFFHDCKRLEYQIFLHNLWLLYKKPLWQWNDSFCVYFVEFFIIVKNPVYEKPQDDIQMERHGEKATTFSGKDSQPTYMELVDNRGELVSKLSMDW